MYNYYQNQNQMYQRPVSLKGRPVSSLDEARASAIDFDGSIFYFPDLANNKIYTKQINMDGTQTVKMYSLTEIPVEPQINDFITREEFQTALAQLKVNNSKETQSQVTF